MRKITIAALAVICSGVLLGGIGTGVAVAEYTSLEYSGEHILGEESLKQENLDVTVVPVEGKKIYLQDEHRLRDVVYDSSVPENTIRYSVRYNPELVTLRAKYEDRAEKDYDDGLAGNCQGIVWLRTSYTGRDFDLLMRNKDQILNELKQGKIGSYYPVEIDEIIVRMNPQMKHYVEW